MSRAKAPSQQPLPQPAGSCLGQECPAVFGRKGGKRYGTEFLHSVSNLSSRETPVRDWDEKVVHSAPNGCAQIPCRRFSTSVFLISESPCLRGSECPAENEVPELNHGDTETRRPATRRVKQRRCGLSAREAVGPALSAVMPPRRWNIQYPTVSISNFQVSDTGERIVLGRSVRSSLPLGYWRFLVGYWIFLFFLCSDAALIAVLMGNGQT